MGFIHEHIILQLSDLITGQCVHQNLQFLLKSLSWDNQKMRMFQDCLFEKLIRNTISHVPFYRTLYLNGELPISENVTIEDLQSFPIVDKSKMRREGLDHFSADNIRNNKKILCHSSGTTGEPFAYYVSKQAYSINIAAKLRTWYEAGYRLGDSYMKIASAPRGSIIKKVQDKLNNCTHVPFQSLDTNVLQSILITIDKTKPSVIRTHPNVAFYLAMERNVGSYCHVPKAIMTTSSNLTDIYRETIQKAFRCDVIDSYSCEGTANIAENKLHDGYHISHEYGIVEILNDNNQPVKDGYGHVVATDLWNLATPFIRYNTHDRVEVREGVIVRIIGRENEMLEAANGKRYSGQIICDYFSYETRGVLAYQLVAKNDGKLLIKIVPDSNFDNAQQTKIVSDWEHLTGQIVCVQPVKYIPVGGNGKSLTVISE